MNPRSIRDWELYKERGAGQAARELTSALVLAKRELRTLLKPIKGCWSESEARLIEHAMYTVMRKHMYPAMERNADMGASDTEPRYVAIQSLADVVKKHYNVPKDQSIGVGDYL